MKNLIPIIAFTLFCTLANAQTDSYPEGIYKDFQELSDKSPSENYNVELEERSKGEIRMNGGNDYQLNPIDENTNRKYLKREVYAYSDGKNLYINCFKFELQFWYSKIKGENEKYLYFKAGIPMNPKRYGIKSSDYSYIFGGIISGYSAAKRALIRFPYVLDKTTQEAILVSDKNISDFIGSSPILTKEFEKEHEKDNVDVISKYLLKWINGK